MSIFSFILATHFPDSEGGLSPKCFMYVFGKLSIETRSKIYRCDSDKAAMVAHDHVTSKCQTKSKRNEIMDI